MKKLIFYIITILSAGLLLGCEEFLDERPDKSLVVPASVEDLQLMLDNSETMNNLPSLGIISSDDLYLPEAAYNNIFSAVDRNAYTWEKEIYEGEFPGSWAACYGTVYISNVVLEKGQEFLENQPNDQVLKSIIARAKFYRAFGHYNALTLFAAQYDPSTSTTSLGIPLKLNSNILEIPVRHTLEDSYGQVIKDLEDAIEDLPLQEPIKTRPSKYSAFGLLSRIYHSMGIYDKSKEYAEMVMEGPYSLMDYNTLNAAVLYPFPRYNGEVVFHGNLLHTVEFSMVTTLVDPDLLASYDQNDLRREMFYIQRPTGKSFRGQYTGMFRWFGGVALDEIYLNYAEASIRLGEVDLAIQKLNDLMEKRYLAGSFVPLDPEAVEDPLKYVIDERRKELAFRGLNWLDLKRLNLEGIYGRTLQREIAGQEFVLLPNDKRYVLPLPEEEIRINNLEQNPR